VDWNRDGSPGICDPALARENRGRFVECVARELRRLVDSGDITRDQAAALQAAAARSDSGRK